MRTGEEGAADEGSAFDVRLGEHLRRVRQQKGLSLLDVEAASEKRFKASVLGAYERGERALSVKRLAGLAELYRVPLPALLPPGESGEPAGGPPDEGIAVDLERLQQLDSPEGRVVWRYAQALQRERGDWGGVVLTMRRDDLRALGAALDVGAAELVHRLEQLGVRSTRAATRAGERR